MVGYFGSMMWGNYSPVMICLFAILMIWSAAWKGVALWKAAGKRSIVWFIILFVTNTLGILDILYVYIFSECCGKKQRRPARKTSSRKRRR
jgi:hypothetical protein